MTPLCASCNNAKTATGKPGRSSARKEIAATRSVKRNASSANRKAMRTIMTSDPEGTNFEDRNSKLENRDLKFEIRDSESENRDSKLAGWMPSFDFRFSTFVLNPALLLTLALVLSAGARTAYGAERVWEKRFDLPPGGHVSVVNVQGSVLVEGWDRAEVEATVAMRSAVPTDQLDEVQVA